MSNTSEKSLREVMVFNEDDHGVLQPQTFQMCGLGVQFYSNRLIEDFEIMEFDLLVNDDPKNPENVHCTGAVVRCQEVNEPSGRYRVWLKFIDTPETTCSKVTCIARKGKHLCTFCENF